MHISLCATLPLLWILCLFLGRRKLLAIGAACAMVTALCAGSVWVQILTFAVSFVIARCLRPLYVRCAQQYREEKAEQPIPLFRDSPK